jgi:hypothetical protein
MTSQSQKLSKNCFFAKEPYEKKLLKNRLSVNRSSQDDFPSVLRIRDVYPGSRIPDPDFYPSRIPDPGSRIPDPGSKNSNKRGR